MQISVGMALDHILCGLLLVGLGLLGRYLQPDFPPLVFAVVLAGGGLSVFWSIWGYFGKPWRLGAVLTVALSAVWIAYHAVQFWRLVAAGELQTKIVPLLMLLLVYLCGFTLFNLLREGKTSAS